MTCRISRRQVSQQRQQRVDRQQRKKLGAGGRLNLYAPDINDGVKVNVRPFQELGLLAAPAIKKWE